MQNLHTKYGIIEFKKEDVQVLNSFFFWRM